MMASSKPTLWEAQLKQQIRRRYDRLATDASSNAALESAIEAGYPAVWLDQVPTDLLARYSGCGFLWNRINTGGINISVDLGSGAGLDSYIAKNFLGWNRVVSIDLAPQMGHSAKIFGCEAVTGDIERLPLPDNLADAVFGNASFNLAADKRRAFAEAFRILKPRGQLRLRDLVLVSDLPPEVREDPLAFNTSLGGAVIEDTWRQAMEDAGFCNITFSDCRPFSYVVSTLMQAEKR
jgi:arsenite methyltransferase